FTVALPIRPWEQSLPAPEKTSALGSADQHSTFKIAADALAPNRASTPTEQSKRASQPNVLVVEDNDDMRSYLRDYLETRGLAVQVAKNGREALREIESKPPEVVLSDIMMPEMDGYQLVQALKSDNRFKCIPVILITAKASKSEAIHALEFGADDFLPKP